SLRPLPLLVRGGWEKALWPAKSKLLVRLRVRHELGSAKSRVGGGEGSPRLGLSRACPWGAAVRLPGVEGPGAATSARAGLTHGAHQQVEGDDHDPRRNGGRTGRLRQDDAPLAVGRAGFAPV